MYNLYKIKYAQRIQTMQMNPQTMLYNKYCYLCALLLSVQLNLWFGVLPPPFLCNKTSHLLSVIHLFSTFPWEKRTQNLSTVSL